MSGVLSASGWCEPAGLITPGFLVMMLCLRKVLTCGKDGIVVLAHVSENSLKKRHVFDGFTSGVLKCVRWAVDGRSFYTCGKRPKAWVRPGFTSSRGVSMWLMESPWSRVGNDMAIYLFDCRTKAVEVTIEVRTDAINDLRDQVYSTHRPGHHAGRTQQSYQLCSASPSQRA